MKLCQNLRFVIATATCLLTLLTTAGFGAPKTAPLVGVYYFPGWYGGKPNAPEKNTWNEWRDRIMQSPKPRAICGFYDDSDPKLWDYYIDWMTGHGIDFIAFDWYDLAGWLYHNDSLDKGFLGSEGNKNVRFALHWCNHQGDQSRAVLLKMIDLACERYFSRPNYLRINGCPVFMIYDTDMLLGFGGVDQIKSNLRAMRGRAMRYGFKDLYLVDVYSGVSSERVQFSQNLGYDAFVSYTYAHARIPVIRWDSHTKPYSLCVENCVDNIYPFLSRVAKAKGISYWPCTFSGWDDRPRAGVKDAYLVSGNTPELFGKMFRGALEYVDPASPVVMIEAWNEWGEGAAIEPDKEHGFGFLEQIAKALGKKAPKPRVPSDAEIASWNMLNPQELAAAKEAESLRWELQPTLFIDIAKSRQVPPAKLPVIFNFPECMAKIETKGITIEKRGPDGLVVVATTQDPWIKIALPDIPTAQVKRVTIEGEALDNAGGALPVTELFFMTALVPDGSSFCMVQMPPYSSGRSSILTSDILGWEQFGTPLTTIRVDFAERIGVKFLLKRVTLE